MIVPLAISVSFFGGICAWLFLETNAFLIWAAFIAWACFFQMGGNAAAFKATIISNFFGVVVAWAAGLALATLAPTPVIGAIIVAISIAVYILAAHLPALSSVPAVTFGYAATFAYLTQNPDVFTPTVMLSGSMRNVLLLVPFSMVIGACFAFASALGAAKIEKLLRSSESVKAS